MELGKRLLKQRALLVGVGLAIVAGLGGVTVLGATKQEVILPGTRIGDIALGGLTQAAASELLKTRADEFTTLEVQIDDQVYPVTLADWGIRILPDETAASAFALGNADNPLVAGWNRIRSFFRALRLSATLSVDSVRVAEQAEAIALLASLTEKDARLIWQNGGWQVEPSVPGATIASDVIQEVVLRAVSDMRTTTARMATLPVVPQVSTAEAESLLVIAEARTKEPINLSADGELVVVDPGQLAAWTEVVATGQTGSSPVTLRLNQVQVEAFVKALAGRFDQEPVDATVVFRDGVVQVTQESRNGRKLDTETTVAAITTIWTGVGERTLDLVFSADEPEVSSTTLQNLGLKELIGTARTSYVGSPDNRKHNIANGVKYLNSKLVKPGTEFSTVSALGAVDDTTGYLPELVIKENRTTPEYGGGLCQVSTTLFRAAMNAGLKITERRNHSYRVSYYEVGVGPGLDATIYLPSPDMKFLNDTLGWILVQGYVVPEKNEVVFELYGTSDGRRSEISKPDIYETSTPGAPIYVETADLPTGEVKQIEKAHDGAKTVVTYRVMNADGSSRFEQTFRSNYKAWPARYLVGTGPAPVVETPPAA